MLLNTKTDTEIKCVTNNCYNDLQFMISYILGFKNPCIFFPTVHLKAHGKDNLILFQQHLDFA